MFLFRRRFSNFWRSSKARLKLAMLFITHDLNVAAQICDRIAVMRQGEIIEVATAARLLSAPEHDYTRRLLAAIPGRLAEAMS